MQCSGECMLSLQCMHVRECSVRRYMHPQMSPTCTAHDGTSLTFTSFMVYVMSKITRS